MDTQQAYAELYLIPGAPAEVIEAAYLALTNLYSRAEGIAARRRLCAIVTAYHAIQKHRGEDVPAQAPPISPRQVGQETQAQRIKAIIEEQGRRARKRMEPFKSIEGLKRTWEEE